MQSDTYDGDHDMNNPTSSTVNQATISQDVDMEPRNSSSQHSDTESLPDLMDLSGPSDSSSETGSAAPSAADELEVVMQAVDDSQNTARYSTGYESSPVASPIPTPSDSRPTPPRSRNRRARVEDDEDEERDRRHPFQRIGSPNGHRSFESSPASRASPSPTPSSQGESQPRHTARIRTSFNIPSLARTGLDQTDPLRFFQHLMPQSQAEPNNPAQNTIPDTSIVVDNEAPSTASQPAQEPDGNIPSNAPPAPQDRPHGNDNEPEQNDLTLFTEIMMRLGLLGAIFGGISSEPDGDDPERAKKLVAGLEEVPVGLVRRLERVGGTDDPDGSRDTMCAICWDQLLDEAGFSRKQEPNAAEETLPPSSESPSESSSSSSSASPPKEEPAELQYPKIVALPCAHVFHADCLIPWFSRPKQTTCPSCRFNIDPENLTRVRRRRSAPMPPAQPAPTTAGQRQPDQANAGPAQPSNDPTAPPSAGQDDNQNTDGPHFVFGDVRIPIVVAAPPFVSFGGAPRNSAPGAQGGPNDQSGDQRPNDTNENNVNDDSPPTEPATPSPPSQPGQQQTRQDNNRGVAHGIVFGFDVIVGGPISPSGPQPDGNTADVDEGAGNGNGDGDRDRDWLGMMMRDLLAGRGDGPPPNADNPGQENANPGNGGEARPNTGFPRVINMNLGNGESLHIASGMGRTMGEAMAQLLSSMTANSGNQGPNNANAGPGPNPRTTPATDAAAPMAADAPQTGPLPQDAQTQNQAQAQAQTQNQNNQNQEGGIFTAMGSFPFQMMAQMFGFGSPDRVRRGQSEGQGQNQPSEPGTNGPAQAEAPPSNDAQAPGAPPRPATGGNNTNDEGLFARLVRNMLAGNPPPPMTGQAPGNAEQPQRDDGDAPPPPPPQQPHQPQPHVHFFPPGLFSTEPAPPSSTPSSNGSQSEKRQWTPPPAPGPTLRERIEKREREVGLRCCDMSCGVGPSDEDPLIPVTAEGMKQLILRPTGMDETTEEGTKMCPHTFHPSCLVSTERVALRGADAPMVGDDVEVSCSVCRAVGRVSKEEWEAGVQQLS